MSSESPTDELTDELTQSIAAFTWTMARRMRHVGAEKVGMSLGQVSLLAQLQREPGSTSAELARKEQITPQSMSAMVHELRTKGYLTASADSHDGRARRLQLTPEGEEALDSARRLRAQWMAERIDDLIDPKTRGDYLAMFNRLLVLAESD